MLELLADAEQALTAARAEYADAVEAVAATRSAFTERQGMVLFMRAYPDGRCKPGRGYLQNQPGAGLFSTTAGPAPMFETTLACCAPTPPSRPPRSPVACVCSRPCSRWAQRRSV